MSPLAFDKQGKPFAFHRRTRKLLVRLFRNPAARGTCCQVLGADGEPLLVDAETDYIEFRKLVGNVPGLYRLDQCDDDGIEIEDAPAAYVSIDITRNAAPADGDVNPLVIIEHLVAIQADVLKTMAAQQAALISASAEILRAPFRPPLPPAVRVGKEDAKDDDEADDDDELDDDDLDLEPDPWAAWRPLLKMAEPHLPKLGAFLYEQFAQYMKTTATSPPAAAPLPTPASAPVAATSAPSHHAEPMGAAAGSSVLGPPTATVRATSAPVDTSPTAPPAAATAPDIAVAEPADPAAPAASANSPSASEMTAMTAMTATTKADHVQTITTIAATASEPASTALAAVPATAAVDAPRNASPAPPPAQWTHLYAIRERLSAKERAIAENAITRMTPDVLAQWLAELSAMSVDDAIGAIRAMIARLRSPRSPDRG